MFFHRYALILLLERSTQYYEATLQRLVPCTTTYHMPTTHQHRGQRILSILPNKYRSYLLSYWAVSIHFVTLQHNISINSQTDTCNSVFPRLKYQSNIDDLSTMVNIIIIIMFSVQRKEYLYLQMFE